MAAELDVGGKHRRQHLPTSMRLTVFQRKDYTPLLSHESRKSSVTAYILLVLFTRWVVGAGVGIFLITSSYMNTYKLLKNWFLIF